MKSLLFISVVLASTLLSAREINPLYPDFNHQSCYNRSVNPAANHFKYLEQEALSALVKMQSADIEAQSRFQSLHPAYKAYFIKLLKSVRSDGSTLSSYELDKQLDLSGTCDNATDVLLDIINNLK